MVCGAGDDDGGGGEGIGLGDLQRWSLRLEQRSTRFDTLQPAARARARAEPGGEQNNFLKGCKWSPDGLCIAACSDDSRLRLFNLPEELLNMEQGTANMGMDVEGEGKEGPRAGRDHQQGEQAGKDGEKALDSRQAEARGEATAAPAHQWDPALVVAEGELVYDYCWLPCMTSGDPATCMLASSCRDHPVHAWDAFNGTLVGSYRCHDQYDEIAAPRALTFTTDSVQLYCGHRGLLHIFEVERPGRDYMRWDLTRQHMRGIISTMAFNADGDMLVAGCYGGDVALMDCMSQTVTSHIRVPTGVTHAMFSPREPHVFAGTRMSRHIWGFDMRNMSRPLLALERDVATNQRVYFDIDPTGQFLVSGEQGGGLACFDLWSCQSTDSADTTITDPAYAASCHRVIPNLHHAATNGVSVHPYLPLVATASGQRQFSTGSSGSKDDDDDDDDDARDDDSEEREGQQGSGMREVREGRARRRQRAWLPDNTLKLWRVQG